MSSQSATLIHPQASIHPSARVDPSSRVGPGAVLEPEVVVGPNCSIGAGTILRTRAIIVRNTTLGEGNVVHPYAVLGGDPQDRSFDPARPGELIVGNANIFREYANVSRGNWNGPPTRIGSNCFLMANAHVGHNAQVGSGVTMANNSCLAGHVRVGDGCFISACCFVHQFTHVGEMVMFRGGSGLSMHAPPFVIVAGENQVIALNAVGLRRNSAISSRDREEIREVFRAFYRSRGTRPQEAVLEELSRQEWGQWACRFLDFIRDSLNQEPPRKRGICGGARRIRARASAETAEE